MGCSIKLFKILKLPKEKVLVRPGGADAKVIWHALETFLFKQKDPLMPVVWHGWHYIFEIVWKLFRQTFNLFFYFGFRGGETFKNFLENG